METKNIKIAIIGSMFWEEITESLEKNCIATLKKSGVMDKNITIVHVPGALEIPLVAQRLAKKKSYNAIITFGAIVKGDTYHFEQVANECIRGCMDVSRAYEVPVIFEVLAVYKIEDAIDRATSKEGNKSSTFFSQNIDSASNRCETDLRQKKVLDKGVEAAETALEMIDVMEKLQ